MISYPGRLLGAACYFGFAPAVSLVRRLPSTFFQHHRAHALGMFFLCQMWFVAVLVLDIGEWIALVQFPDLTRHKEWLYVEYAAWALLAGLGVFWMMLVLSALRGSTGEMPLLTRLTRWPWVIRFSFVINSIALALIPILAVLALHATSLTRTNGPPAAVYFLYDEGIPVPRWAYALGLYRLSLQTQRNDQTTVLDRLDKETLRQALAHGRVVIFATHGGDGNACTYYAPEKLCVAPPQLGAINDKQSARFLRMGVLRANNSFGPWENVDVNDRVRMVYMFGCDTGKKAAEWKEHLAPAQVFTYDRYSTVFDHGLWFFFTGPAELRKLL